MFADDTANFVRNLQEDTGVTVILGKYERASNALVNMSNSVKKPIGELIRSTCEHDAHILQIKSGEGFEYLDA